MILINRQTTRFVWRVIIFRLLRVSLVVFLCTQWAYRDDLSLLSLRTKPSWIAASNTAHKILHRYANKYELFSIDGFRMIAIVHRTIDHENVRSLAIRIILGRASKTVKWFLINLFRCWSNIKYHDSYQPSREWCFNTSLLAVFARVEPIRRLNYSVYTNSSVLVLVLVLGHREHCACLKCPKGHMRIEPCFDRCGPKTETIAWS